jgi:hypothetical protein
MLFQALMRKLYHFTVSKLNKKEKVEGYVIRITNNYTFKYSFLTTFVFVIKKTFT